MKRMLASDIEANVVSYSAMVDACAKAGEPALAEKWHHAMLEKGIAPNAHSFSVLINAWAKVDRVTVRWGGWQGVTHIYYQGNWQPPLLSRTFEEPINKKHEIREIQHI